MSNKKIDIAQIRKYLNGELDARAMFELEREAHNDPFLWDTIKGMEAGTEDHQPNLDAIDQLIKDRVSKDERRTMPVWKTWPVAASLIIALGIGGWLLIHGSEQPIVLVQTPKFKPADRNTQTDKFKPEPAPALKRGLPVAKPALIAALNREQIKTPVLKPATPVENKAAVKIDTALNYMAVAVPPKTHKDSGMFLQQVNIASRAYVNKKSSPMASSATISSAESDVKDKAGQIDTAFTHALPGRVAGVNVTTTKSELEKYFPGLVVTGKITDGNDHSPLPGVSIRARGSNATTQTGPDGTFKIAVPNKGETLDVAYIGYQTKQVKVKDRDSLNIALKASNQSLAEVAVIGYGTAVKPDVAEAQPKIGWKAYDKYLKDNATMPDGHTGTIKLTLTVGIDGGISNIKIVKGLSDEMNKKAIQLITNGPGWVPQSDRKPAEVKVKIEFH